MTNATSTSSEITDLARGYRSQAGPKFARVWAKQYHIGKDVVLLSDIGTQERPLEYLYLGDGVYIGEGCNIQVPKLVIGDYTKIHRNSLVFGRNPLKIGYNCWFGESTIIDCEGTTTIGNGVGAGAHSQLWSHIRHGDVLEGCRYLHYGRLTVEDDVWFVGHCIVSPVHAAAKSMAMVGSVVTKDMEYNHVYGGSPAKDLTDKLGTQFVERLLQEKFEMMADRVLGFYEQNPDFPISIVVTDRWLDEMDAVSQFNVATRTYTKQGTPEEQAFMRYLLPEVKFMPAGEGLP